MENLRIRRDTIINTNTSKSLLILEFAIFICQELHYDFANNKNVKKNHQVWSEFLNFSNSNKYFHKEKKGEEPGKLRAQASRNFYFTFTKIMQSDMYIQT